MPSQKSHPTRAGRRLTDLLVHEAAIVEALRSYLRGTDMVKAHTQEFAALFGGILGPEVLAALCTFALCLKNAPAKSVRVEQIQDADRTEGDEAIVSLREELVLATLAAMERNHFALAQHLVSNQIAAPGSSIALRRASHLALLLRCADCPCGRRMTPANGSDEDPLPAPPPVIRMAKPLAGPGTVVPFPAPQKLSEDRRHENTR